MQLFALVAGIVLAISISACVSMGWVEGYTPRGPGRLVRGPCPSSVEDNLRVPVEAGVELLIHAVPASIYPVPHKQISLDLRLLIPEGVKLQLLSPHVILKSAEWPGPKTLAVAKIEDWTETRPEARSYAPGAILHGSARAKVYPGLSLSFVPTGPRSQTSILPPGAFTMELPQMRINDKPTTVEPIHFSAYRRQAISIPCD